MCFLAPSSKEMSFGDFGFLLQSKSLNTYKRCGWIHFTNAKLLFLFFVLNGWEDGVVYVTFHACMSWSRNGITRERNKESTWSTFCVLLSELVLLLQLVKPLIYVLRGHNRWIGCCSNGTPFLNTWLSCLWVELMEWGFLFYII